VLNSDDLLSQVMHSSLAPHLHSPKCNALIALLLECHKENPFRRFTGYCNKPNYDVNDCLREERETNRKLNSEKSKAKREEIKQRRKDGIDDN